MLDETRQRSETTETNRGIPARDVKSAVCCLVPQELHRCPNEAFGPSPRGEAQQCTIMVKDSAKSISSFGAKLRHASNGPAGVW